MRIITKIDKGVLDGLKVDRLLAIKIENALLKASVMQIFANWSNLANSELNSTRIGYLKGLMIQGGQINRNTASISLKGTLNNMLENGASSFDLKKGFSQSTKRVFNSKGQWYLTIPIGEDNSTSVLINQNLPQEIFAVINQSIQSTPVDSSVYSEATKFADNKGASKIPTSNSVITTLNQIFENYKAKSQISAKDPVNNIPKSNVKFFRVSEKSRPDSWIHKGLAARNFGERALAQFKDSQETNTTRNVVINILKENQII